MHWSKRGLIYSPEEDSKGKHTFAQVPTGVLIDPETYRIFFSTRDELNRSQLVYIDVLPSDLSSIKHVQEDPIMPLGLAGTFDDCGVMPTWLFQHKGQYYLYYIGWNVRNTVPYHNATGLAISQDGQEFHKISPGPVLGRTMQEPYFTASACVLHVNNNWLMWYLSCIGWKKLGGRMEPFYHIKFAGSNDGIHWKREGKVAIELLENEGGVSRPSVIFEGGLYRMWYSYRGASRYREDTSESYKIGYAESVNGVEWLRMDSKVGIGLSHSGWDSDMIEYPHVQRIGGNLIMLYNGNAFGKSGIGYAVLDEG